MKKTPMEIMGVSRFRVGEKIAGQKKTLKSREDRNVPTIYRIKNGDDGEEDT